MSTTIKKEAKSFFKNMSKLSISTCSASSAFYIFLSFVPIFILICSVVPYTALTEQDILSFFSDIIPASMFPLFKDIISDIFDSSLTTISIYAVTLVWSAGKAFAEINNGLNYINGIYERKNFFVRRLRACFFTVAIVLVFVLSLVAMVFGKSIINIITEKSTHLQPLLFFFSYMRFIFLTVILALVFLLIYKWGPDEKTEIKNHLPGAVFSSLAWVIFSWLFSLYVNATNSFNSYGRLATIIIALFWIYFCMYIFFCGAYINRFCSVQKITEDIKAKRKAKNSDN